MTSSARLLVWHPDTAKVIESVPLGVRAIITDDDAPEAVLELSHEQMALDVTVDPSWVGMVLTVEVSPRTLTSDATTRAVVDVAKRMRVPVG